MEGSVREVKKSEILPQKANYPQNGMSFFAFCAENTDTVLDIARAEDYNE